MSLVGKSHVLVKPLHHRKFPSPMRLSHNRLHQTLQVVVCLQLYQLQHHRQTTTALSRRAAKEQYQRRKQLASHSAYKRCVDADLCLLVVLVVVSVGCCATRRFERFQCIKRHNEVLRNSIDRQAERYALEDDFSYFCKAAVGPRRSERRERALF